MLDRAADRLRIIYGEEVGEAWVAAYRLHREGFHEERLTVDGVRDEVYKIVDLLKLLERELGS